MIALLDGDIFAYRAAVSAEKEDAWIAVARCRDSIERTLYEVGASEFEVWLSAPKEENFRYSLFPEYKAGRPPHPKHLYHVKQYLQREWGAQIANKAEADDALGIAQSVSEEPTIICTIDKDLRQVPGEHYHFVNRERVIVSPMEGLRNFYTQILLGDTTDNIRKPEHLNGFGKAKVARFLAGMSTESELFLAVRDRYSDDERLLLNGRLLWIQRYPHDIWEFPKGETCLNTELSAPQEEEAKSSCLQPKPSENDP